MKPTFLFLSAFCCALALRSEVKLGENILLNGRLETDQTEMPLYWTVGGPSGCVALEPSAGPGGVPCVTFRNTQRKKGEFTLRQYGLTLATNGLYRISAQIRTKNFASSHCGATVLDTGWYHEFGPRSFKANQDWTRVEKTFRPSKSSDGRYSVAVFAINFTGELSVADLRLEALDAPACADTKPSIADVASRTPRLVPWGTRLRYLPRANPELAFRCFGKLPEGGCDLEVKAAGTCVRAPLVPKLTTLRLPDGVSEGDLSAVVIDRAGGTNLCGGTFAYRVVDPVETSAHRRLNNLVTEVLAARPTAAEQAFAFTTTRDGWTFTAIQSSAKEVEAWLDGRRVIAADTPRHETFREIPYGRHTLVVKGAAGGRVIVRQIAEVFNYCPGVNSFVGENPAYDWAFQKRYAHPAVTTQNGGNVPKEHRAWFRAQGYQWLANLGTTKLKDENDLTRRLEGAAGMNEDCYDGLTCDEQFFGQPEMLSWYTHGLRACPNASNRRIYTWIVGKPGTPGVDHDFLCASAQASRGRGRVMFEAYCRTRATEDEAKLYLENYVTDTLAKYKQWCPGVEENAGIALGNFNQIPILSLSHHPEVDYKYYLDLQYHMLATDPAFAGLGCTGYWGSYYADHELHRWSLMLMRHYCVEGATEMLSARYGFRYLPGHLANGDFRGSLDGWTATGKVATDEFKGIGSRSQNRWGGNGTLGDTFAVFSRGEGTPDTLKQTLKGLVPGRAYCLQFATFDVDDMKASHVAPREFGLAATLSKEAELRPDLSWVHIDKRVKGRYAHNDGVGRINLHHTVFIARAAEVSLAFDDAAAKAGERLGLNCVSLNPFLLEER